MTITRTLADFEREEKRTRVKDMTPPPGAILDSFCPPGASSPTRVSSTKVRVRSDQAIELAVIAGVEDSLNRYAAEHVGELFPEYPTGEDLVRIFSDWVTEGVVASLSHLLTFEDEE